MNRYLSGFIKVVENQTGMKITHKLFGIIGTILMLCVLGSCLNEDNKIPENCYDGVQNNAEAGIDCGGPCPACDPCENNFPDFDLGETWVDCGGECGPCDPSFNGIQDGDETGIDCGGSTGVDCGQLCNDGLFNGLEDAVDCGGPCEACPTCDDMELNQDETGIDCGGVNCPPCAVDASDCTDGMLDGDEQYIDCGGSNCPPCEEWLSYQYDGNTFESDPLQGVWNGGAGTITLNGATGGSTGISITLNEPLTSWDWEVGDPPVSISLEEGGAEGTLVFTAFMDVFSTANLNGNGAVSLSFVNADAGGFVVGTFTATPTSVDGEESASLFSGSFRIALDD